MDDFQQWPAEKSKTRQQVLRRVAEFRRVGPYLAITRIREQPPQFERWDLHVHHDCSLRCLFGCAVLHPNLFFVKREVNIAGRKLLRFQCCPLAPGCEPDTRLQISRCAARLLLPHAQLDLILVESRLCRCSGEQPSLAP